MAGRAISVYLTAEADAILLARGGDGERSATIRRALQRYAEVCERDRPRLSVAEWRLCCDALNGHSLTDQPAHWAEHSITDGVVLSGLDSKWGVSWPELRDKLNALSHGGWVALVDEAERFWSAVSRGEEPKVPGEE